MGRMIELVAADGHRFDAWEAQPGKPARGGLVVAPEIFGVNGHIRSVADRYAADGYHAIAPALFDRVQRKYETGYEAADIDAGRAIAQKLDMAQAMLDVAACVKVAQGAGAGTGSSGAAGRVGIVGYCWGGNVAWVAAARVDGLACSIVYYGGRIADWIGESPRVPVLGHFGEHDKTPSPAQVRDVAAAHRQIEVHFYDAGHGFNCDQRGSWDPAASQLAGQRTLDFLAKHVG